MSIGLAWYSYVLDFSTYYNAFTSTLAPVLRIQVILIIFGILVILVLGAILMLPLASFVQYRARAKYLLDYVDEKGQRFILPRIESPSSPGTHPAHEEGHDIELGKEHSSP
jgi:hypothetical protein